MVGEWKVMKNTIGKEERSFRAFIEVMVVLLVMVSLIAINKSLAGLAGIVPVIYFLIERRVRRRNHNKTYTFLMDLKKNWYWILLVAVGFQTLDLFVFTLYLPEMMEHIALRTPLLNENLSIKLMITILIAALGEEIAFRGLIQARFSWYLKPYVSIPLTSIIFALMHLSDGNALIVTMDMASVFLDSIVFGIIYYRTQNIWMSWIAHAAANIVAFLYLTYLL